METNDLPIARFKVCSKFRFKHNVKPVRLCTPFPIFDHAAIPVAVITIDPQPVHQPVSIFMLRAELLNRGIVKTVSTILTQVTVDPYDEAFYAPTKVIGRYMSAEDAETETKKGNYVKEEPGKGFRRVVAAPRPIGIVEIDAIRTLAEADQIVIACGGGGIPVIEQNHILKGASAVIEKDAVAGRLAAELQADELIILTGVPQVYRNFGKPDQEPVPSLTVPQARQLCEGGQFEEGTMLPKIEAAISYLEAREAGRVLITSLGNVKDALKGKSGTIITI